MNRIEILIPISRPEHLSTLFAQLERMECDTSQTSILAYVDGDASLFQQVQTFVDHSKFHNRRCIQRLPVSVKPDRFSTTDRRIRISAVLNELKKLVGDCDYILGLEDDTIPPTNTIKRLLHDYALYPYAGMIEGVALGRWGFAYVGAWRADNVYEVGNIKSCLPPIPYQLGDTFQMKQTDPIEEIDAGGFYCFMTKREYYVKHEFKTYGHDVLGPDVEFGLSLRQEGYKNYIDWSLSCKHMRSDGKALEIGSTQPISLNITKVTRGDREIWMQKINRTEDIQQNQTAQSLPL